MVQVAPIQATFERTTVKNLHLRNLTATHYAVLSLLLCLSNSPIRVPYVEPIDDTLSEKDTSFDWASYLLEDIEVYKGPFTDSSDSSDYEDDVKDVGSRLTFAEDTHHYETSTADLDHRLPDNDLCMEANDWLMRNVVVQYWSAHVSDDLRLKEKSSVLLDWENYQSRINPVFSPHDKMPVTEHHIIRETIWLLLGVPSSVVYVWNGVEYKPNEDLSVTHLTQECLSSVLTSFAYYGTIVRHLYEFKNDVSGLSTAHHPVNSQTYQAFTAALSVYLQQMQKELVLIEKNVLLQEESHTLIKLLKDFKPHLMELETLEVVYTNGIAAFSHVTGPSQKASGLLGVLFEMIRESDSMGEYSADRVALLLSLWIQASKPYLDIIDQWTTEGQLMDPYKEFIIQRNIDIRSLDENFWDTAFTLHCSDTTQTEGTNTKLPVTQVMPSFLLPVLNQIILAGKSMELIHNLGYLSQVHKTTSKKGLYERFMESVQAAVSQEKSREVKTEPKCVSTDIAEMTDDAALVVFRENISKQMQLLGTSDPLLCLNFINVLNVDTSHSQPTGDQITDSKQKQMKLDSLTPVQLLLENCLYPHITNRSADLLDILKQDYCLDKYFAAVKLRLREPWQDPLFLNCTMQEALQSQHSTDADNVYVTVEAKEDHKEQNRQHLMALEGLTVPWPVNIVINSRCLQTYNEVFSFLLQIKWVKYSLDELKFTGLDREDVPQSHDPELIILGRVEETAVRRRGLIHHAHVMRMKLIHFVNNLHNYIMTRILHSTGLEFKDMLATANDLDTLIKVHNIYLSKVHERCLLHKKVAIIRDIITKILELSLVFAFKWEDGVDSFSYTLIDITHTPNIVLSCTVESLAFALIISNETLQ
ncbi:hypothetical protein LSH36_32g09025 [Paralvinella palmiformis]|uniref:Gamma-tubulin complex component n=1 Tax=Paralvinella palmiformis TaxID=53620 RepID=A0AAD9K997_9ANNE|nr:hypothetical protein LSH36_32g09025 [Paralvinella palmiformis]